MTTAKKLECSGGEAKEMEIAVLQLQRRYEKSSDGRRIEIMK